MNIYQYIHMSHRALTYEYKATLVAQFADLMEPPSSLPLSQSRRKKHETEGEFLAGLASIPQR